MALQYTYVKGSVYRKVFRDFDESAVPVGTDLGFKSRAPYLMLPFWFRISSSALRIQGKAASLMEIVLDRLALRSTM